MVFGLKSHFFDDFQGLHGIHQDEYPFAVEISVGFIVEVNCKPAKYISTNPTFLSKIYFPI